MWRRASRRAEPVDLLALAAEEAAHFDLEVSGDAVTIKADPMLLRRLVRNLLENARVHAGGATDLRIERSERHAHIVVEDAGAGVPAADRDKIFEPFSPCVDRHAVERRGTGAFNRQTDRARTRRHGGVRAASGRGQPLYGDLAALNGTERKAHDTHCRNNKQGRSLP